MRGKNGRRGPKRPVNRRREGKAAQPDEEGSVDAVSMGILRNLVWGQRAGEVHLCVGS